MALMRVLLFLDRVLMTRVLLLLLLLGLVLLR